MYICVYICMCAYILYTYIYMYVYNVHIAYKFIVLWHTHTHTLACFYMTSIGLHAFVCLLCPVGLLFMFRK